MGSRILIIDDNEQDRKIIARFLNIGGYEEVFMADTGESGLEEVESKKPDVVIIDTLLPGINGFEVCQKIREIHGPNKPKIIMTTGTVDAIDAVKARKAGADDYCAKTSDPTPLVEAVKKLV